MLERKLGLAGLDVPELHGVVTGGTGKNDLGSGVEQDMAYFPGRVSADAALTKTDTYLMCPLSLATGETSAGSSPSLCRVKFSGTCQMKTYAL